jgi:signal peptidase I
LSFFKASDAGSTGPLKAEERLSPRAAENGADIRPAGELSMDEKRAKGSRRLLKVLIEIAVIVAAAFAIAMLVQAFIIKPFTVHQVSMKPTLLEGDRILLSRLTYHFRDPKAGDVVVFHSPLHEGEDLVKRIVAVAGDRVAVHAGDLYVNGLVVEEPYLLEPDFGGELREQVVPPNHVFVMGDNRDESGDSRLFGPIDTDLIIGEALCIYWPIGRWRGL